jgi:hypothetical protein
MYSNSDLGRFRQADLVREAEAYRRASQTASARAAERRATARKVLSSASALLLWPIKH